MPIKLNVLQTLMVLAAGAGRGVGTECSAAETAPPTDGRPTPALGKFFTSEAGDAIREERVPEWHGS